MSWLFWILWFGSGFIAPYLMLLLFRWSELLDARKASFKFGIEFSNFSNTFSWCPMPWIIVIGVITSFIGFIAFAGFVVMTAIVLITHLLEGNFGTLEENSRFAKFLAFMAKPICKK